MEANLCSFKKLTYPARAYVIGLSYGNDIVDFKFNKNYWRRSWKMTFQI